MALEYGEDLTLVFSDSGEVRRYRRIE